MFFTNPTGFIQQLNEEVEKLKKKAEKLGMTPCVRLNGTSDLPKVARQVAEKHPDVQFYDYTKLPKPWTRTLSNYDITFSRSEDNIEDCLDALEHGINVAVVFENTPQKYLGREVISGEENDLRFLDKRGTDNQGLIVGLKAKGRARTDTSGFVVRS